MNMESEDYSEIMLLLNRRDSSNNTLAIKVTQTQRSNEIVTLKRLKTAFAMAKKISGFRSSNESDDEA